VEQARRGFSDVAASPGPGGRGADTAAAATQDRALHAGGELRTAVKQDHPHDRVYRTRTSAIVIPGVAFVRIHVDDEYGLYAPADPVTGIALDGQRRLWFRTCDLVVEGSNAC
jgi:hypothetical protein